MAGTYKEFKESLDKDIRQQAEGFVRIGYKLRLAEDTDILKESGYKNMAEFAKAEYGFDGSITSRYININKRYSVDGYSDRLKMEYSGYGYTKLAEMLTLPDMVIEAIDPQMTREDIRGIKREIEEEKQITELEVLMEGQQPEQAELAMEQKAMHQYFYEHREAFVALAGVLKKPGHSKNDAEDIMDTIAPSGMAAVSVRVRGIGKLMIFLKGTESDIDIQNVRTLESKKLDWTQFIYQMKAIYRGLDLSKPKQAWEEAYHEPFSHQKELPAEKAPEPIKPVRERKEIAPAQKFEKSGTREETESTLLKSMETKVEGEAKQEIPIPESQPDVPAGEKSQEGQQVPGQDTILNHPEMLPANYHTEAKVEGETITAEVEPPSAYKKACEELLEIVKGNFEIGNYTAALKWAKKLCERLTEMTS